MEEIVHIIKLKVFVEMCKAVIMTVQIRKDTFVLNANLLVSSNYKGEKP